jgi:hypothetical protein
MPGPFTSRSHAVASNTLRHAWAFPTSLSVAPLAFDTRRLSISFLDHSRRMAPNTLCHAWAIPTSLTRSVVPWLPISFISYRPYTHWEPYGYWHIPQSCRQFLRTLADKAANHPSGLSQVLADPMKPSSVPLSNFWSSHFNPSNSSLVHYDHYDHDQYHLPFHHSFLA